MIKELTIEKTSLPVGWEMKKIDEVVIDYHQGLNTAGQKIKFVDEGYPIIQTRNLNQGEIDISSKIKFMSKVDWELYKDKYKPSVGDVFLTNIGTIGKTAVVTIEEDYLIHWNIFIFKLDKSKVLPLYLKLFLDSPSSFDYYHSFQKGGTVSFITKKMISNLEIPLPPLNQQKQIVAILVKAFAAIDTAKANAEQNLQNAKELFESYLQNVFENKGEDWENKPLSEVCDLIKRGSQPKYTESESGEIVLNQKCIRDHKINLSVARKHDTNKKTINKERYIQLGDGLINSTGTGTLGRVAQVRVLNFSAFVDTHITIVRPKKDVFYLDFFGWALIYIEKIIEKSGEGASGQTELSRKLVEKLVVSFPEKMKQQEQIVLKLDALSSECKKLEAIYTQKIADLKEMKKSVLQKAFSGQLNTIN
jgi:type I restriction enzyme S subunit